LPVTFAIKPIITRIKDMVKDFALIHWLCAPRGENAVGVVACVQMRAEVRDYMDLVAISNAQAAALRKRWAPAPDDSPG